MSQRGMSIIEVLIAAGLIAVVASGLGSVMANQAQETRAVNEKLAALELQQALTAVLADGTLCKYVANSTGMTINTTGSFPQTIHLPGGSAAHIPSAAPSGGVAAPDIVTVGKPASPIAPGLLVKNVDVVIAGGGSGSYLGRWTVNFDETKWTRAIRPVVVTTTMQVDLTTPPAAAQILSCQSGLPPPPPPPPPPPTPVRQGSWCGLEVTYWGGFCAGFGGINYNGRDICGGHGFGEPCEGMWPASNGCPSGYGPLQMCFESDLHHNCNGFVVCVKQ